MATTSRSSQAKSKSRSSSNGAGSKPRSGGSARSANGKPASKAASRPKASASKARSSARKRAPQSRSKPAARTKRGANTGSAQNGLVTTVKNAAGKAGAPALAVGAAAAGLAGGLVLKSRSRPRVLGIPLPRSLGKSGLTDLDVKSVAKTVGKASAQFGQASKSVSKDIERVGDQAERVGKILG
jgi:hypothetical protein